MYTQIKFNTVHIQDDVYFQRAIYYSESVSFKSHGDKFLEAYGVIANDWGHATVKLYLFLLTLKKLTKGIHVHVVCMNITVLK